MKIFMSIRRLEKRIEKLTNLLKYANDLKNYILQHANEGTLASMWYFTRKPGRRLEELLHYLDKMSIRKLEKIAQWTYEFAKGGIRNENMSNKVLLK